MRVLELDKSGWGIRVVAVDTGQWLSHACR